MRVRSGCVLLVVFVIGCEGLKNPTPQPPPPRGEGEKERAVLRAGMTVSSSEGLTPPSFSPRAAEIAHASEARHAGSTEKGAWGFGSVQAAPDDPLVLVARCLERADHRGAAAHLETYVRAHPDQPLFRLQLAELYVRCGQVVEAKVHAERFVEDAAGVALLDPHAVTAHITLMELAQRADDRFAELYHRGAGLLLLVKTQDKAKDRDAQFCEEMLCKALRALTDAKELRPNDPRARAQLAAALERVGSRRAAGAERAAARASVTSGAGKLLE